MSKQTAMQALVDLLKVKDAYKQCMPYIIEIIDEVYLPMEREQIEQAYIQGCWDEIDERMESSVEESCKRYYNETYKGGEQ
jgi:hypothetical protein